MNFCHMDNNKSFFVIAKEPKNTDQINVSVHGTECSELDKTYFPA